MKRWSFPLLLLLLAALAAACLRLESVTRDQGMSREAHLNPWLAAGRLLERQDLRVRMEPDYGGLPRHARVIVLATPLEYLDTRERDALFEWVRAGGHLVSELQEVAPAGKAAPEEVLARRLDVRLREQEATRDTRRPRGRDNGPRPTQLDQEGQVLARFNASYYLTPGKHAPSWVASDANGPHAMRFAVGAGRITVLSDLDWMHNRRLGDADHAALLWRVVDAPTRAEVWLIHGVERPSLLRIVWDKAAWLLLSLGLFVLAWLWGASRRFGPLQPPAAAARRRLGEHLEASGRYLLRHGGLATLFNASRERLLGQAQRRHPQWRSLPPAALAEQLALRARLEPAPVRRLLEGDAPDHLLQFAADIRLINRLRKAL
ncbi:MAG: hypothetical protein K0Q68_2051 [Moraxellaceae bacterium]|jgi:hypothetical protein|nr:hypothetical protein [Moraxellaceae bacterium]